MQKLKWYLRIWYKFFPKKEKEKAFIEFLGYKKISIIDPQTREYKMTIVSLYKKYTKKKTLKLWMRVGGSGPKIYLDEKLYDETKVIDFYL